MPEEKQIVGLDPQQVIDSLIESNNILQGEVAQIRRSNRILRTVNSTLRKSIDSLRKQVAIAQDNDELFKQFCNGDFDVPSTQPDESGLLEPGSGGSVGHEQRTRVSTDRD